MYNSRSGLNFLPCLFIGLPFDEHENAHNNEQGGHPFEQPFQKGDDERRAVIAEMLQAPDTPAVKLPVADDKADDQSDAYKNEAIGVEIQVCQYSFHNRSIKG
jgi:hypothetical protein